MPDTNILVVIERIYRYQFKSRYLKTIDVLLHFFFAFLVSTWNFQWAGRKISLIAQVFLKLFTPKDVLITMDNSVSFWKPFRSEHVNESQKLLNSAEKYLYPTISLFRGKLSYKELLLMRSEFLGLLLNTLTANYEYSRSNRENLPLPIQIKLTKKP